MNKHALRLLALSLVLGVTAIGHDAGPADLSARAAAHGGSGAGYPVAALEIQPDPRGVVAWDCVPDYWWGYWTWAWQPCAWLDRSYVEGTIGAVADATPPASAAR